MTNTKEKYENIKIIVEKFVQFSNIRIEHFNQF